METIHHGRTDRTIQILAPRTSQAKHRWIAFRSNINFLSAEVCRSMA